MKNQKRRFVNILFLISPQISSSQRDLTDFSTALLQRSLPNITAIFALNTQSHSTDQSWAWDFTISYQILNCFPGSQTATVVISLTVVSARKSLHNNVLLGLKGRRSPLGYRDIVENSIISTKTAAPIQRGTFKGNSVYINQVFSWRPSESGNYFTCFTWWHRNPFRITDTLWKKIISLCGFPSQMASITYVQDIVLFWLWCCGFVPIPNESLSKDLVKLKKRKCGSLQSLWYLVFNMNISTSTRDRSILNTNFAAMTLKEILGLDFYTILK